MTLKGLTNIVYGEENKLFENVIVWMDKDKYYPKLRNYDTKKWFSGIKQDNFYLSEDQIRSLTKKCIFRKHGYDQHSRTVEICAGYFKK